MAYNLSEALKDRVFILNVKPDFEIWKEDFAFPRGIDPMIVSFLNFRPNLFYTFDKRRKNASEKTFATPRSYELASDALKTGLDNGILRSVLSGCLGEGVATEFVAFRRVYKDLPNIHDLFSGKYDQVPSMDKPDVLYALVGALTAFVKGQSEGIPFEMAMDKMLEYAQKLPPEFAVLTLRDAHSIFGKKLRESKGYRPFSLKFKDLII